jgi:hypothetical protein
MTMTRMTLSAASRNSRKIIRVHFEVGIILVVVFSDSGIESKRRPIYIPCACNRAFTSTAPFIITTTAPSTTYYASSVYPRRQLPPLPLPPTSTSRIQHHNSKQQQQTTTKAIKTSTSRIHNSNSSNHKSIHNHSSLSTVVAISRHRKVNESGLSSGALCGLPLPASSTRT